MASPDQVWEYYNNLPVLYDANISFTNREAIFADLTKLLAEYDHEFGVCLVHTHCTLEPGEIMLGSGNISQPTHAAGAGEYFAERWLQTGQPYEFTTQPTRTPPIQMMDRFRAMTGSADVLGLYYAGRVENGNAGDEAGEIQIEWTEGRVNKMRRMRKDECDGDAIETAWNLGQTHPNGLRCKMVCEKDTSYSNHKHTKRKEHVEMT